MRKFTYQFEKFSLARRCLMLPHSMGEAQSVASAFQACHRGLDEMGKDLRDSLDDNARGWVSKLEEMMDTSGLKDESQRGLFLVKAETLSEDEMRELAECVDNLAYWFGREAWGTGQ